MMDSKNNKAKSRNDGTIPVFLFNRCKKIFNGNSVVKSGRSRSRHLKTAAACDNITTGEVIA